MSGFRGRVDLCRITATSRPMPSTALLAAAAEASRRQAEAIAEFQRYPDDPEKLQAWFDAIDATQAAVRAMWGE